MHKQNQQKYHLHPIETNIAYIYITTSLLIIQLTKHLHYSLEVGRLSLVTLRQQNATIIIFTNV